MKYIIVPFAILSIFTGIGCLNNSTGTQPTGPVPTILAPQTGDTNSLKIQTTQATTIPPTITLKPVSTAGLNPAHGQPGHRCDISVGAPLDSKPAQTTIQPQPAAKTTTSLTTLPVTTGAGLNPAHGQPGHRCEIAVGAPLDSKPTQ